MPPITNTNSRTQTRRFKLAQRQTNAYTRAIRTYVARTYFGRRRKKQTNNKTLLYLADVVAVIVSVSIVKSSCYTFSHRKYWVPSPHLNSVTFQHYHRQHIFASESHCCALSAYFLIPIRVIVQFCEFVFLLWICAHSVNENFKLRKQWKRKWTDLSELSRRKAALENVNWSGDRNQSPTSRPCGSHSSKIPNRFEQIQSGFLMLQFLDYVRPNFCEFFTFYLSK